MSSPIQQKILDISSLTSKLLRKNFGRGPESCYGYANHQFLIFHIRGFLSPMESILLENGDIDKIDISRNIVMKTILTQLKGILEIEFNQDIKEFYHDWNYHNNTGAIMVEFENKFISINETFLQFDDAHLIDEVNRLTNLVEKIPEATTVYRISPRVCLVKRDGILVPIEKALIAKGYSDTLIVTKDELEKTYFHRDGHFQHIFQKPVLDIFIDWNFQEDKSMLCFVLKQ